MTRPAWFIRRALAFIPAALVVGLLTFPTICFCGGQTPHSHALFLLSHHDHHAEASAAERSDSHEHHDHAEHADGEQVSQSVAARRATAGAQQVSVQAPAAEGGISMPLSVMTPFTLVFSTISGTALQYQVVRVAIGVHLLPDTPPPRLRLTYSL
ncbi:MAG: hypothetical protein M9890_04245 [Thermomicrobiales bacterium]|nr:hypothetical protein [Thermomicrobiales bacterium]